MSVVAYTPTLTLTHNNPLLYFTCTWIHSAYRYHGFASQGHDDVDSTVEACLFTALKKAGDAGSTKVRCLCGGGGPHPASPAPTPCSGGERVGECVFMSVGGGSRHT
jgi:hypothetical protein